VQVFTLAAPAQVLQVELQPTQAPDDKKVFGKQVRHKVALLESQVKHDPEHFLHFPLVKKCPSLQTIQFWGLLSEQV